VIGSLMNILGIASFAEVASLVYIGEPHPSSLALDRSFEVSVICDIDWSDEAIFIHEYRF